MRIEKHTREAGENSRTQQVETIYKPQEVFSLPIENTPEFQPANNQSVKKYITDGEAFSVEGWAAGAGPSRENFFIAMIAAVVGSEFGKTMTYAAALGLLVGYFSTGVIGVSVGLGVLALVHIVGWVQNKIRENRYYRGL